MKIVLDTNCLYHSLYKQGDFYLVWQSFIQGKYTLCVSTEILEEYQEIIAKFTNADIAQTVINVIVNAANTEFVMVYYHWNLIETDKDDNKFTDCAIACGATYIVSNDKHFNPLKKIDFPKLSLKNLSEFCAMLKNITC
ncbi:MAG: putative toxin-antitoxin system toxin component, PIN family [Paludibacteraceae bacterium]